MFETARVSASAFTQFHNPLIEVAAGNKETRCKIPSMRFLSLFYLFYTNISSILKTFLCSKADARKLQGNHNGRQYHPACYRQTIWFWNSSYLFTYVKSLLLVSEKWKRTRHCSCWWHKKHNIKQAGFQGKPTRQFWTRFIAEINAVMFDNQCTFEYLSYLGRSRLQLTMIFNMTGYFLCTSLKWPYCLNMCIELSGDSTSCLYV